MPGNAMVSGGSTLAKDQGGCVNEVLLRCKQSEMTSLSQVKGDYREDSELRAEEAQEAVFSHPSTFKT